MKNRQLPTTDKFKRSCGKIINNLINMENNKMVELGTPIGKFIIDNAKGTQTKNGVYYHYSDVVSLLKDYKEQLRLNSVTCCSLGKILSKQTNLKLANEIKEIQAAEVFNYIVNEHDVKLTYREWRKTVKNYYR